jgi:uncharacterized membrane protein
MANEVTVDVEIDAPSSAVFDFVADYNNAASYMYGLEKIVALTEHTSGLGAQFEGTMKLGASLHSSLEVTEFEQGTKFTLASFKGIKNTSYWTISSLGDNKARAVLRWEYDLGGGIAGKALGKIVEPFVKIAAAHSSKELKKAIEASL